MAEFAQLAERLCTAMSFPAPCRVAGDHAQAFEIHAMRRADAFLIWRSQHGGELDETSHDLVTRTLPYLGLEIARLGAMREMELRFASELVDLMEAQPPRLSELAHRLESLGVSPHRPLAVIALRVEVAGTRSAKDRVLYDVSRDLGVASIAVSRDHEEFLIIEAPDFERVADLGDNLLSGLSRHASIRKATLGLGNVASSVDRLRTSLLQARQACALAESGRRNFAVATFRDIATHRLVMAVSDKHVKDSLVQNLLSPIRNYDRERGAFLEETLAVFLEHNGNWKPAADRLHIHVNTLRYRIERIAALTGRDLSSMADRVDFYLAIHASDARGNGESAEC
jgi:sugar diacid utilization regulator